jgi:hypothetical protein
MRERQQAQDAYRAALRESQERQLDEMPGHLTLYFGEGRGAGRTTALLEWVLEGRRCPGYPGWTRVMVVPTIQRELQLRKEIPQLVGLSFQAFEDWSHRVFAFEDWQHSANVSPPTQVMIDGLEDVLPGLGWNAPGSLVGFAINTDTVRGSLKKDQADGG